MKILIKYFGACTILLLIVLIISQLSQYNVRSDELTSIVTTAMTNTQTVMQEQQMDSENDTDNKRYAFNSNEEYVAEFSKNLYMLQSTNRQLNIRVLYVDCKKGILSVEVDSSFRIWNGSMKTISAKKTGVIEQLSKDS